MPGSNRIRQATAGYPRQFWLLFWGMWISATGGSMFWPFMTIYIRQRLDLPLTTVALLFTLNSAAGLVSTFIAGPVVDRLGRKWVMVLSLAAACAALIAMSWADTLPAWVALMAFNGAFGPLYRVGSDAMVADLIGPDRRADAYALLRTSNNLGVAVGPAVGGVVTSVSYALAFYIAAGANALFALLILFFAAETIPRLTTPAGAAADPPRRGDGGYGRILRDGPFLAFCGAYALATGCGVLMWMLMPVYAKELFSVPESQIGLIMTTNAAMVVSLQYVTTQITRRFPHLPVLAVGALFYGLGVGSVAWGWGFPTFLASMVVITIGEMVLVPTATTLTANLAPPTMRGRYMSVFGLTWSVAFGIAPVIGGYLNDLVAPAATWYGGLAMGLVSAAGFLLLAAVLRRRQPAPAGA